MNSSYKVVPLCSECSGVSFKYLPPECPEVKKKLTQNLNTQKQSASKLVTIWLNVGTLVLLGLCVCLCEPHHHVYMYSAAATLHCVLENSEYRFFYILKKKKPWLYVCGFDLLNNCDKVWVLTQTYRGQKLFSGNFWYYTNTAKWLWFTTEAVYITPSTFISDLWSVVSPCHRSHWWFSYSSNKRKKVHSAILQPFLFCQCHTMLKVAHSSPTKWIRNKYELFGRASLLSVHVHLTFDLISYHLFYLSFSLSVFVYFSSVPYPMFCPPPVPDLCHPLPHQTENLQHGIALATRQDEDGDT